MSITDLGMVKFDKPTLSSLEILSLASFQPKTKFSTINYLLGDNISL